ncbi:uromodulin-like [Rana temporaria]|uniref:uromodulin-like n=1 Tax=Rana temporaria TaxID=8407 RepID=UPI001AAC90E1|nr:uromodulin-like [Rana temporaria]
MKTTLLLSVLCAVMAAAASQPCTNEPCATDEFCNSTTSTACQCNKTLYSFTRGKSPSPILNCTGAKFNIQVSKCWLEANGYNTSDIRLNGTNSGCFAAREIVNGESEMTIHFPVTSPLCNTVPVPNTTHVTYSNQLYIFAKTDPIQTTNDAVMNFSCSYPLNINVTLNVTLHPVIGSTVISGPSGNGSYVAVMLAYKDEFITPLSDSVTLKVEDTVYISVQVPDLDVNAFKLKVVNIYASATELGVPKYYLLQNGCPAKDVSADQLSVVSNGYATESRFAMKVFKIASSDNVYLYADLALCTAADCNSTCTSRSVSRDSPDIAGRVSIYLNAADTSYVDTSSASGFSMPWTLSALIFSCILMKLM